ncbi:hypothetical protein, partial [Burkholderia cenocepacia]
SLKVLTLGLINLNQITVNINIQPGQVTIPVANQGQTALTFKYPGPGSSVSPSPAPPYTLSTPTTQFLAPAVQGIANSGISFSLSAQGGLIKVLAGILSPVLNILTGPLLSALGSALVPLLLQPVDSLLTAVTGLLGLSLGNASVTNAPDWIKCGNPILVQ